MSGAGRLVGIGVGPGDPELLTLKAVRRLREAEVVAYVSALGKESVARRIVAAHLQGGQRELPLPLSMDPDATAPIADAGARLAAELEQGREVALLCEGDPLLYGSFIRLAASLVGRFAVEVVPGISAVSAAAATALVPLARRDASLHILPATLDDAVLEARLAAADAAVIMKVGRHLSRLRALLTRLGLAGHATYVEHATTPAQRILPLAQLADETAPYFSLLLVQPNGWPR